MTEQPRISMYADLACPFAYLAHFRWRRVQAEGGAVVHLLHKCLSLEYVNREPTPKLVVEAEVALLAADEFGLPHQSWSAAESAWPVTLWPAFEAVKCAERQGSAAADELAWVIRRALFAESRCVSLRHILFELAEEAGLDLRRFEDDFDAGVAKRLVVEEARDGWERLGVPGSPTFVLASGEQIAELGLPEIEVDPATGRATATRPSSCHGDDCLEVYRAMRNRALTL